MGFAKIIRIGGKVVLPEYKKSDAEEALEKANFVFDTLKVLLKKKVKDE